MIFQAQSVKEQIAEALLKQIRSGKIAPGSKLKSIRELAREFSVSIQSIVNALDILENQGVVRRDARSGVIVRNPKEGRLNIGLLALSHSHGPNSYFSMLSRMVSEFDADREIIMTIWRSTLEKRITLAEFSAQVQFLERNLNIDCLLLNAPSLTKGQISAFGKFKCPVIILGDFSGGIYGDIPCSQIMNCDTEGSREMVCELFEKTGSRKILFFSGSREHFFYRQTCQGISSACDELNIEPLFIETPPAFSNREEAWKLAWLNEKLDEVDTKGIPLLNLGLGKESLLKCLHARGLAAQCYEYRLSMASRREFAGVLYELIQRKVGGDHSYEKILLHPRFKVYPLELVAEFD